MPAEIPDYESFVADFDVAEVATHFTGDIETGMNVCVEACDRWAADPDRVALYWEGADGSSSSHTYAELKEQAGRFANFLTAQGIGPGDRVAVMLPRIPALFVAALSTWRAGAVYQPLFTAFGPKAIEHRVSKGGAKLVVTDAANRPKLNEIDALPPVALVTRRPDEPVAEGDIDLRAALARQPTAFEPVLRGPDDPFLQMFTSGTVGLAKGVPIPQQMLLSFIVYMKYGIGLRPEDRYWSMADPGWAYGLFYAVTGPLLLGHSTHFQEGTFSPEATYRMIEKYDISLLVGAPTAYRMMMAAGDDLARTVKGRLRAACSGGEPLNPEVVNWVAEVLGCPVHDQYGLTETGMLVCQHHGLAHSARPGSMGRAQPGFRVVILDDDFNELGAGAIGQIAVDTRASPLYSFAGYQHGAASPMHGPYYLTGDMAELDAEGGFSFMGRNDDVITSAGYRIGPFDVESCLIEHPAVAESAAVGKPDEERGEIVVAFVVLRDGETGSPGLAVDLQQLARTRLSAHAYPREIHFTEALPKTPSGKIQRFLLRQGLG